MGLTDILTIVIGADADQPAIAMAEHLAQAHDAHLAAAFLTALPDEPLAYEPTVVAGVWAELLARARGQAEADRTRVEWRLKQAGRPVEIRMAEALSRDLGRVAAVHARYADLAVLTRPTAGDNADMRNELIEGVLFHAGRPVLIAPQEWAGGAIGRNIVIAWDASREATRAVADARPFLEKCQKATILTIDAKPKAFGHGEAPGANIAAHLSRLGISVTVRNADSMGRTIGKAMMDETIGLVGDLLVMGAYRHSRLQERLFGGATRELLEHAKVPVLLSH
jgi:nucleotide-binding universal stress UspA family protein